MVTRAMSFAVLALAATLWPARSTPADVFRLVEKAREAAQVRVDLIRQARSEIDAEYFIVGDDRISMAVLALLGEAAGRGVRVRLLVDGQWNRIPPSVQGELLRSGVEIREYHPFRLTKPRWLSRRLHDKILLADRERMVIGGRNIEAPYFGFGREVERRNYVDRDVFVQGKAAGQAWAYFLELWESGEVREASLGLYDPGVAAGRCDPFRPETIRGMTCEQRRDWARRGLEEGARTLAQRREWLEQTRIDTRAAATDWSAGQKQVQKIRFLHDPIGRKEKDRGIGHDLLELMESSERSLLIESPYLVPSRAFREGLERALARGVHVRILTNSLAVTDNLFPQSAYDGKKRGLVEAGVELWEYAGPECLHSKSALIDDEVVIVGTFNLDPRSEHLNSEVAVVVQDAETAGALRASMDSHLLKAVRIGPDGNPLGHDGRYPPVGAWRLFYFHLLKLLVPFIHKQL